MSETPDDETPDRVSMTKKPAGTAPARAAARGRKPPIPDLPLPSSMKAVFAALGVVIVGNVVRAIAIVTSSPNAFRAYEIHTNNKAKKPKKPYTAADIASDIHALRSSYVVYAVLSALVVAFLITGLRRARSASGSRWVLIFALFFTGGIGGLVPPFGFPGLIQGTGVVIGIAALVSIALVFSPPSLAYARACRDAVLPEELRGQPRPKLFGPRPTPASTRPTTRPAARPSNTSTGGNRAKSKARSDAEAIARGAELARSRARASKSRRTDV